MASGRKGKKPAAADAVPVDDAVKKLDRMEVIEQRAVDIDKIFPSPENPRRDWDSEEAKAFLLTLGESMRDHTQLEAIIIRESGELIDGESRWRAAKLVGLATLDAKIVRCTDAEAALVRMMSYRQRRDLNAIEEARGLKLLLDKYGCSQRTLEERVRISQGQISNLVRLLNLPQAWQDRIVSGEISATDGRTLATFADRPKLFEWLDEHYEWWKSTGFGKFTDMLVDAIQYASRPITKGQDGPKFKVTDELRKWLDIVEVKVGRVDEPRAFNVEMWGKLQREAQEASAQRALARTAKGPPTAAVAIPTHTLRYLWCEWFGRQIAHRLTFGDGAKAKRPRGDQEMLERLALLYSVREGDIVDAFGLDGADRYRPVVTLMKTNSDELFAMLISSFLERLRDGRTSGLGELDDIVPIAAQLGITFDQFAPDVEMLEDLPEQARLSLFDEWEGLKPAKTPKGQAEQLIDHWEEGWIPEAFKAVELDGVSF